jgi:hypothetical protein
MLAQHVRQLRPDGVPSGRRNEEAEFELPGNDELPGDLPVDETQTA